MCDRASNAGQLRSFLAVHIAIIFYLAIFNKNDQQVAILHLLTLKIPLEILNISSILDPPSLQVLKNTTLLNLKN